VTLKGQGKIRLETSISKTTAGDDI